MAQSYRISFIFGKIIKEMKSCGAKATGEVIREVLFKVQRIILAVNKLSNQLEWSRTFFSQAEKVCFSL